MPSSLFAASQPPKTLSQKTGSVLGTVAEGTDVPRQKLFTALFGTPFGEDVTGNAFSGTLLELVLDPLIGIGPAAKVLKIGEKANLITKGRFLLGLKDAKSLPKVIDFVEDVAKPLDIILTKLGKTEEELRALRTVTKPPLTRTLKKIPALNKIPGAKGLSSLEQFIVRNFKRKSLTPEAEASQAIRDIELNSGRREAEIIASDLNTRVKEIAKTLNRPVKDVSKEIVETREIMGVPAANNRLAELRLQQVSNFAPQATKKVLKEQGRFEELEIVKKYQKGLREAGVKGEVSDVYAEEFIKLGGPKRTKKEITERFLKAQVDPLIDQANEYNKRLVVVDNLIKEEAKNLDKLFRAQIATDIAAGIDIEPFRSKRFLNYITHRITPLGRTILETTDRDKISRIMSQISTRIGFAKGRKGKFANLTIDEVNNIFRKEGLLKKGEEFFSTDIGQLFLNRELASVEGRAIAKQAQSLINTFARADPKGLSLAGFIKESGLRTWTTTTGDILDFGKKPSIKKIKALLEQEGYGGLTISKDFLQDAKVLTKMVLNKTDPALKSALNLYDKLLTHTRALVTVPFPAFHARNFLGNVVNGGILGGSITNPRAWFKGYNIAAAVYKGTFVPTKALRAEIEELIKIGVIGRGLTYDMRSLVTAMPATMLSKVENRLFDLGQFIEDGARAALYIAEREKGATKLEALKKVNKFLFDYEHGLDVAEKAIGRRIGFFYTWTRFNTPLQLEQIIKPTKLYKFNTLGRLPGLIPNNHTFAKRRSLEREQGITRPAFLDLFGTFTSPFDPDKLVNVGFPTDDINISAREPSEAGRRGIADFVAPTIRAPVELLFQRDLFFGGELQDKQNFIGSLIVNYLPQQVQDFFGARRQKNGTYRINPSFNTLLKASPASRFLSTVNKLTDPDIPEDEKFMTMLTAFLLGNPKSKKLESAREKRRQAGAILKQLRKQGKVGFIKRPFAFDPELKNVVKRLNKQNIGERRKKRKRKKFNFK